MDPSLPRSRMPLYASVVSLLLFARRKRLRAALRHAALILTAALLGSVLLGCNGGFLRPPSTPPGTYTVTITGTSGTTMQSAQITVVVQ